MAHFDGAIVGNGQKGTALGEWILRGYDTGVRFEARRVRIVRDGCENPDPVLKMHVIWRNPLRRDRVVARDIRKTAYENGWIRPSY